MAVKNNAIPRNSGPVKRKLKNKKNSIGNGELLFLEEERMRIQKIEQGLTHLHHDYKDLCRNLHASSACSSYQSNFNLKSLLAQVEGKTTELMAMGEQKESTRSHL